MVGLGQMVSACAVLAVALSVRWSQRGDDTEQQRWRRACGAREMQHLSELPVQGMHVLSSAIDACEDRADSFAVKLWVDGFSDSPKLLELSCRSSGSSAEELLEPVRRAVKAERPRLHRRLVSSGAMSKAVVSELRRPPPRRSWKLFTALGAEVLAHEASDALRECGTLYLFEGGSFMWPPVRPGHRVTVPTGQEGSSVTLTTVAIVPRIFTLSRLLTPADAAIVISQAEPEMKTSAVQAQAAKDTQESRGRTSTQCLLPESNISRRLGKEIHTLLRVPGSHGEPANVLRYTEGQHYAAHNDHFPQQEGDGGRNRLATVFVHLAAPKRGGATHFPLAVGAGDPVTVPPAEIVNVRCGESGVKVPSVEGTATLFYSLRADGAPDPFSLHAGCPPESGTKWAIANWVWNEAVSAASDPEATDPDASSFLGWLRTVGRINT